MALEIERRFLLNGLPDLPYILTLRIRQGYLGEGEKRVRLRERASSCGGASWYLCKKSGQGLVREEKELPIDYGHFELLWPLFEECSLTKTRHVFNEGDDLNWEIDRFDGLDLPSGAPLVLMEVELPHPRYELSIPSSLSPFVIREVTEDPRWTNSSLARHGLPLDRP